MEFHMCKVKFTLFWSLLYWWQLQMEPWGLIARWRWCSLFRRTINIVANGNTFQLCPVEPLTDLPLQRHPTDKAYFIAKEILMTERTYKKDLEVINLVSRPYRHIKLISKSSIKFPILIGSS